MRAKGLVILLLILGVGLVAYRLVQLQRKYLTPRVVEVEKTVVERIRAPLPPNELKAAALKAEVRFFAQGDRFYARVKERDRSGVLREEIRELFVKGINLGPALPGTYPAQFAPTRKDYLRWFRLMAEAGFNAVRVYTVLPPEFYDALREYNLRRGRHPLYLLQGVWATDPEHGNYFDEEYTARFEREIVRAVHAVHGRSPYFADVSEYTLGFLLGREWEPHTVLRNDQINRDKRTFQGVFFSVPEGTPTEVWLAARMELLMAYETSEFGTQRPVSFVNWLPLDPLYHNTEWIEDPRVREYDNDLVSVDFNHIHRTPWNRAGFFATYHAYPYYPDFINFEYAGDSSRFGPDNYAGYLRALKQLHRGIPLFIAEFGVPSSRGIAHFNPYGMHQGGHTEREQGEIDYRLFQDLYDEGCAGGALFSWMDEWFKRNWLFMDFEIPLDRNPLWHNVYDAEQTYGLLAFGPQVIRIDGEVSDWEGIQPLVQSRKGRIRALYATADPEYLYLRIDLDRPLHFEAETLWLAIDTYDPKLGDRRIPVGNRDLRADHGVEFLGVFPSPESARILVDTSYTVFWDRIEGIRAAMRPKPNDDGLFIEPRLVANRMRVSLLGDTFPSKHFLPGRLIYGRSDENSLAEWFAATPHIEIRLPWNLLNVTDPSSHRILFDDPQTPDLDAVETDGFAFALLISSEDGLDALPALRGNTLRFTRRYRWEGWEKPQWRERIKESYFVLKEKLPSLESDPSRRQVALTPVSTPSELRFALLPFPEGAPHGVSLVFEEGLRGQAQEAPRVLLPYRMRATFGVRPWEEIAPASARVPDPALQPVGEEALRALVAEGHEIALHDRPSAALQNRREALERKAGAPVTTLLTEEQPSAQEIREIQSAGFERVIFPEGEKGHTPGRPAFALSAYPLPRTERSGLQKLWSFLQQPDRWKIFLVPPILPMKARLLAQKPALGRVATSWDLRRWVRLIRNSGAAALPVQEMAQHLEAWRKATLRVERQGESLYRLQIEGENLPPVPLVVQIEGPSSFLRVEGPEGSTYYELRGYPIRIKLPPGRAITVHRVAATTGVRRRSAFYPRANRTFVSLTTTN